MKKPIYLPILKTDGEKESYFKKLIKKINKLRIIEFEDIEERDGNIDTLETFIKKHREFSKLKMFRRRNGACRNHR